MQGVGEDMEVVTEAVERALRDKGLLGVDGRMLLRRLSGGVSATVVLVETDRGRFVWKRPRSRFDTRTDWRVPTIRSRVEAEAASFLSGHLGATRVPRPVGYDIQSGALLMEAAPPAFRPWKDVLMAGTVDPALARKAGRLLGDIHALGAALPPDAFRHDGLFDAQRTDPYFRYAARIHPESAGALLALAGRFHARNDLVHGDFSPKNLLTDGHGLMLVDHEVVTRGDAAFDVGFFLTHLVLKALRRPADAPAYRRAMTAFLDGHAEASQGAAGAPTDVHARARPFLGGCLVARVAGKSAVDYLGPEEAQHAVALGGRALDGVDDDLAAFLDGATGRT